MASFNNWPAFRESKRVVLKHAVVSIMLAYIVDLALFIIGSASGAKNIYSDWTLYWTWVILSTVIVALIFHSLHVRFIRILFALIVCTILSGTIWYPLLNSLKMDIHNFYGIEYRAASRAPQDVKGGSSKEYSLIYKKDDPELKKAAEELKAKNQFSSIRGFMFWQTGIAYGFGQQHLPKLYETSSYRLYRLALISTVGPVVLVECLVKGFFKMGLLLFLIQQGWYLLRKRPLLF